MARIFQDIARRGRDIGMYHPQMFGRAKEWFRKQAQAVQDVDTDAMLRSRSSRMQNGLTGESIGTLVLFSYDPKWKDRLPYWDTRPLVIPLEIYKDSMLGLNLHYISPYLRARLLDGLYRISERENNIVTRLKVSYGLLKATSNLRMYKPCVKKYLWSHVRSRFMILNHDEWDASIFLPFASFVGGDPHRVHMDSYRKM
jgi:hypothetical protein